MDWLAPESAAATVALDVDSAVAKSKTVRAGEMRIMVGILVSKQRCRLQRRLGADRRRALMRVQMLSRMIRICNRALGRAPSALWKREMLKPHDDAADNPSR